MSPLEKIILPASAPGVTGSVSTRLTSHYDGRTAFWMSIICKHAPAKAGGGHDDVYERGYF
ncbi:MAG: hypothetical protein KAS59_01715 [Alphaproteobacteria bacterium]|nr:hypothetical protein [Alphaproteobacteria bacterium]MCK5554987.1 hypothetical protein [Alphaproteobacteria bacterium]